MKLSRSEILNCPFQQSTTIQNDLREYPEDESQFEKAIEWYAEQTERHAKEPAVLVILLGHLGNLERVSRKFLSSENHLREAIRLAQSLKNSTEAFANQIRLGICLHWSEKFTDADALFVNCIRASEGNIELRPYLDIAYQQAGKSKFDQKHFEAALKYFEKAMELRRTKGNPDLIESTALAIKITRQNL